MAIIDVQSLCYHDELEILYIYKYVWQCMVYVSQSGCTVMARITSYIYTYISTELTPFMECNPIEITIFK
jgi:hypothetical protein